MPHLKEIISTGTTEGWKPLKHDREDKFTEWALVENSVVLNGTNTRVGCFIAKDRNGKIYYDLYINKTAAGYIPEYEVRASNGLDISNIDLERDIVNLFVLKNK